MPRRQHSGLSSGGGPDSLEENIGAVDIDLSAGDLTEIEDAASRIEVHGGRYNEAAERMTNL